jgi:circadian clock protein KaiB
MADNETTQCDDSTSDDMGGLAAAFEHAAADQPHLNYILTLYVTGLRPASQRAIENIRRLCEEHLAGRYDLQIVDIYQQPALAQDAQIVAAPTLVKKLPPPLRQVIGDLSDDGRVLVALGVKLPGNQEPTAKPVSGDRK